jgi:indolepyruvate ferredoxin oxidoreductase alpha subunit
MAKQNHHKLIEKYQKLKEFSNQLPINTVESLRIKKFGIITSGVSYKHSKDALQYLKIDTPILKISFYPVPEEKIITFLSELDTVFVIEEVEPILENEIRIIAQVYGIKTKIFGKREGYTPFFGELNTSIILTSLIELLDFDKDLLPSPHTHEPTQPYSQNLLFNRPPVLCAGCPHRSSFLELKKSFGRQEKEIIYASDIGCYALGLAPPSNAADLILCMGASIGMASGFSHTGIDRPIVAIIGDSTFWHSGLPGLANAVYNKSNITIMVVDNKTTAMTGQQENPSTGLTALGKKNTQLSIERVCKAMNVPTIVVDPWDTEKSQNLMKEHIKNNPEGPKVIISRRDCIADALRRTEELNPLIIDKETCVGCGVCVDQLGCPAIIYTPEELDNKHPRPIIDSNLCSACTVCSQICPVDAIKGQQIIYREKN